MIESLEPTAITTQADLPRAHAIGSRVALLIMTIVLLIVFAIGVGGLNAFPIRTDELFTVSNIGGFDPPFGPLDILDSIITYSPDHVPLFFLLSGGWASLVGWTQLALRMFSLLLAVLMIAWLYRFGADVFDRRSGLIAAALMGTSAYLMLHFHDFRMYPLLLLLGVIHSWMYWRLAHGHGSGKLVWVLFVVSAIALVYTHSTALILFAGLGVYHVSIARRSGRWATILSRLGNLRDHLYSVSVLAADRDPGRRANTKCENCCGECRRTGRHFFVAPIQWLHVASVALGNAVGNCIAAQT